jgi:hypothetical protein
LDYFDSRAFYAAPNLYDYGIIGNKEHYRNEQAKYGSAVLEPVCLDIATIMMKTSE